MLTSHLKILIVQVMTAANYHSNLAGVVSWNSQYCGGRVYCQDAHPLDHNVRREMHRQSESFLNWLLGNSEAIHLLIVRMRHICSKRRISRYGCLSTLLSVFGEIDSALNPNGILRTSFKIKLSEMEANIFSLSNTLEHLKKSQIESTKRMVLELETLKIMLKQKQEDEYAPLLENTEDDPKIEEDVDAINVHSSLYPRSSESNSSDNDSNTGSPSRTRLPSQKDHKDSRFTFKLSNTLNSLVHRAEIPEHSESELEVLTPLMPIITRRKAAIPPGIYFPSSQESTTLLRNMGAPELPPVLETQTQCPLECRPARKVHFDCPKPPSS
eukprot:GFUD01118528.1.p1 GENE.GFUD01118528.1~~GFUD01118528.1.p1  ORF type:complete len:327 (-),score=36.29 GFUD01118528.1:120-1100(-)